MLPVIVWSPIEQYAGLITNDCPKCRVNGVSACLAPADWTDGYCSNNQPRLIHCVNSNVIIVSRIYYCPHQHRVLGHHPDIIHRFTASNLQCLVPFRLWHVTGFTCILVDYIDHACQFGTPMQQIENMLISNRARLFYTLKDTFQQLQQLRSLPEVTSFPNFDDESIRFWRMSPMRHAIEACFLQNFWQRESAFHHCMSQTSLSDGRPWLSCDHTFKSVCNIGSVRQADRHWIKQYTGLFCVLNADGQVLTWKMTKSLTFENVEEKLVALHRRLTLHGKHVEECFVDTCCSLRPKLQRIFGPQLKVYLDIFHAVQRISKQIPKRHPYHQECLRSLQLVFRDPVDQGPTRTKSTPSPSILRQQLLQFQTVWEGISYNGREILSPAVKNEIRCLLVHIDKGCLSGVLPGRGTNRNERLHRDLNSHMTNSRYGVQLAYALLTSTLFRHNEHISASNEHRFPAPITAYCRISTDNEVEKFGFSSGDTRSENPQEVQASLSKVKMEKIDYKRVQELLISLEVDSEEEEVSHDTANLEFSSQEAVYILMQAVSAFYVSMTLQGMSKTADFNSRNIFFTSFMAMVEGWCNSHQSEIESSQIENMLSSWNLQKVNIPGDGNCLFTSVAFSLVQRIQSGDAYIIERLRDIGIHEIDMQDTNHIQKFLRIRMVEEWNTNQEYYQGFLTVDITTITHEFLQSGHFSGCLGDLMVLTLANILQIPITIFTSVQNMPLLCIMPTTQITSITQPIFLTYTQSGAGHYDCAVPMPSDSISASKKTKVTRCTCGRNPKNTRAACSSWRCACLRDEKGCTTLCTCKGCTNTYGVRPPPSTTRKRQSYDNQRQPLRGIPSHEFMLDKGELNTDGHLTTLEILLLKSIVIYFILHGFDVSAQNIFYVYKQIYSVSLQCELVEFPHFERNIEHIQRFLLFCIIQLLNSLLKLS